MISGGGLGPPSPSAQRGLISGLSWAAERERRDHRGRSSCPRSPFWEQQGMWPLTQGRQSAFFPGAAVAHRTLGGESEIRGAERDGGKPLARPAQPLPLARPSLCDPRPVLQSWRNISLHYTPSPCRGWGTRSRRSGHPVGRVRRQRLWEGRRSSGRSSSPLQGSTLQQRGAQGPAHPLWGLFPTLQSPEF